MLPPIFDMEPSDETANDAGFYGAIVDWDNVHEQHELAIKQFEDDLAQDELQFQPFDQLTFEQHLGQWNEVFPSYGDGEANAFSFDEEDFSKFSTDFNWSHRTWCFETAISY